MKFPNRLFQVNQSLNISNIWFRTVIFRYLSWLSGYMFRCYTRLGHGTDFVFSRLNDVLFSLRAERGIHEQNTNHWLQSENRFASNAMTVMAENELWNEHKMISKGGKSWYMTTVRAESSKVKYSAMQIAIEHRYFARRSPVSSPNSCRGNYSNFSFWI